MVLELHINTFVLIQSKYFCIKIVTKSVEVHWVFRGYEKVDNPKESVNPPPRMIENENIDRQVMLFCNAYVNIVYCCTVIL